MNLPFGFISPEAVLDAYIEGCRTLDAALLVKCFHPKAVMHGYLDGLSVFATPDLFIEDVRRLSTRTICFSSHFEILDLRVVPDRTAAACVKTKNFAGEKDFLDMIHIIFTQEGWSIISKLFTDTTE